MTKKQALTKLKTLFRNPSLPTSKLQAIRVLYSEIKALTTLDNTQIPADLEAKVAAL